MRMKRKKGVTHPIQELLETLIEEEKLSTENVKDLNIGGVFEYFFNTLKDKMGSDLSVQE